MPSSATVDDFRRTFSHMRPHEALDDATPDSVYRSAPRAYRDDIPRLSSTPSTSRSGKSLRTVESAGTQVGSDISSALRNEFIGLEPIGPALWQVYFGPTSGEWFDEELFVIFDTHGIS